MAPLSSVSSSQGSRMGERGCDLRGSSVSRRDDVGLARSGDGDGVGMTSAACVGGAATPRGAGGGITTAGVDAATGGAPEIARGGDDGCVAWAAWPGATLTGRGAGCAAAGETEKGACTGPGVGLI